MRTRTSLSLGLAIAGLLVYLVLSGRAPSPSSVAPDREGPPEAAESPLTPPPGLEDPASAAGGAASLLVRVLDEEGRPAAGARVTTAVDGRPSAHREGETGEDGTVRFEDLPGGEKMSVRATGGPTAIPATGTIERAVTAGRGGGRSITVQVD